MQLPDVARHGVPLALQAASQWLGALTAACCSLSRPQQLAVSRPYTTSHAGQAWGSCVALSRI